MVTTHDLLSQEQAADLLGIKVRTLRYWVARGQFPGPAYIGRRAYYRPETVSDWIGKQLTT